MFLCGAIFALYKYGDEYTVGITKDAVVANNNVEKSSTNNTDNDINDNTKKILNRVITKDVPKESTKAASTSAQVKGEKNYVEYVVKTGDTISKIFAEHIVSYTFSNAKRLIIKENNLPVSGNLKIGMKLRIPSSAEAGYIKHKVVKGESLSVIAKKYLGKKSLSEEISIIEALNGKENTEIIEVGQTLLIQKNK